MNLPDLLTVALASWLLAYALVKFSAPFNVFGRLRTWAGEPKAGNLAEMLSCIYCVSFWTAVLFFVLWLTPARPLVYPFAITGGVMFIHKYVGGFAT